MEETFIKLYRKLLKWRWADDPNTFALWIRLLLLANFEDKGWHNITVKRGQVVTSVAKLAIESGLSKQQTRTCLDRLKDTKEIVMEATNKYTIITICNYDSYQSFECSSQQTNNKQITNEQQTNNKQITTTKERKEREECKEYPPPLIPPSDGRVGFEFFGTFKNVELKPSELRKLQMDFGETETQSAIDDLSCKLMDGSTESNAHYATLTYWLANRRKKKLREKESQPKGRDLIGNDDEFITDNTYQQ